MLGFGIALGLPFALFAAFPAMLKSLPQSGGWLNTVKVVLGFLELGLALKFLSNADLVKQWGLVRRETFLILWTIIAGGLAAYMLGLIKFPHDSPKIKLSFGRITTAVIATGAAVYFATGVFGTNLGIISGFPPPMHYSYFNREAETEQIAGEKIEVYHDGIIYLANENGATERDSGKQIDDADLLAQIEAARIDQSECPLGIHCFHDYDEGMAYARLVGKPVMLDFTGWACVNCRRMEENVWVEDNIKEMLSNEYVLISLYVDEKAYLPEEEQYLSCITGRKVRTVGNKWANLEIVNFNKSSQPLYALLSPDEVLLNTPVGYTPKDQYFEFLKTGLDKYKAEDLASK